MMSNVDTAARGSRVQAAGLAALAVALAWGATAPPARGDILYVSNGGNGTVSAVSTSGGTPTTFASGFSDPEGLAFDAAGNLFVANTTFSNSVAEVKAGTTTPIIFASPFSTPVGLAFDAAGNLFVANFGNNTVSEVKAGTNTPITFASGFSAPTFLVVQSVPEPPSLLLTVLGAATWAVWRLLRRDRSAPGRRVVG